MEKENSNNLISLFFTKIKSKESAKRIINVLQFSFYIIAALFIIFGLISKDYFAFYDAGLYAVLGLIFYLTRSRIVSIIILLLTGSNLTLTFLNKIRVSTLSEINIFLSIIIFLLAIRSVQACFVYRSSKN